MNDRIGGMAANIRSGVQESSPTLETVLQRIGSLSDNLRAAADCAETIRDRISGPTPETSRGDDAPTAGDFLSRALDILNEADNRLARLTAIQIQIVTATNAAPKMDGTLSGVAMAPQGRRVG